MPAGTDFKGLLADLATLRSLRAGADQEPSAFEDGRRRAVSCPWRTRVALAAASPGGHGRQRQGGRLAPLRIAGDWPAVCEVPARLFQSRMAIRQAGGPKTGPSRCTVRADSAVPLRRRQRTRFHTHYCIR